MLKDKLGKKFVVSVEVDPPKSPTCKKELEQVDMLAKVGVDCINISDNPMAKLHMSSLAFSDLVLDSGMEPIMHLTCRSRTVLHLQSDLLGAHALGIRNVLALSGDFSVANVDSGYRAHDLVELITLLNNGHAEPNSLMPSSTDFLIGVAGEFDNVRYVNGKVSQGAHFIQTQPVFDIDLLKSFVKQVNAPVIAGLLLLWSPKQIQWAESIPGVFISKDFKDCLVKGGDVVPFLRDLYKEIKRLCSGCCIFASGLYDKVERIIN